MKKKQRENIRKDYQKACDFIRETEKFRDRLTSLDTPVAEEGGINLERLDEMIESVHQAGKIDREVSAEKLCRILEKKKVARKIRKLYKLAGGIAAAAMLFLVWSVLFLPEQKISPVILPLQLADVTVPTIVYTEEDDSIVFFDSLDLDKADLRPIADQTKVIPVGNKLLSMEKKQKIKYNRIIIPKGYTYKLQLADGSSVTLNAGSELKYPVVFEDSLREVELKGEGFFEVAKAKIPFVVKAGDTQVKVYGTRFNLLYSEELSLSEAVLLQGSIGMNIGDKEFKIRPDERVYHKSGEDTLYVEKVNTEDYTTWMGTSFKYNGASLERIVYSISRWYGVKISLAPELKNEVYTLEIDKSSSLEWVMKALELITEQPVKKEGGEYLIY